MSPATTSLALWLPSDFAFELCTTVAEETPQPALASNTSEAAAAISPVGRALLAGVKVTPSTTLLQAKCCGSDQSLRGAAVPPRRRRSIASPVFGLMLWTSCRSRTIGGK